MRIRIVRFVRPALLSIAAIVAAVAIAALLRPRSAPLQGSGNDAGRSQLLPASSSATDSRDHLGAASLPKKSNGASFEEVKADAMAGSSVAQRKLAEIYDNCMAYSLNSAAWLGTLDAMASASPSERVGIERVKSHLVDRCSKVDGGEPIPSEAATLWLQQAAKNGDVAAQVRVRTLSPKPLRAQETAELIDAAVASRDPATLIGLSELLARPIEGDLPAQYANLAGSPTLGAAWGVAACRLGAECAAGTPLMDALCSGTGRCSYGSYADYLTNEQVPAGQTKEFYQTVEYIVGLYRNRN